MRLVTGNDYKPFTDQTLPQGGMITEIVDQVFQKMGYQAEIEFHSWSRGYTLSEEGAFLGTFPYVQTPERMESFYFSDPIYTITTLFFVRNDTDLSFVHDSDLQGLTACKPLGYHLRDIQDFLNKDFIEVRRPNTMESCFKMLRRGRVDLVPINEHVGWEVVRKIAGEKDMFKVLEKPLLETGLHFIVTRKNPQGQNIV
ncbi:MAG: transporter substrate-binding domain-containing protein, partial [Desulfonatronovibrio sp.]